MPDNEELRQSLVRAAIARNRAALKEQRLLLKLARGKSDRGRLSAGVRRLQSAITRLTPLLIERWRRVGIA